MKATGTWPDGLDLEVLDGDSASMALVRADGTIEWVNRAWLTFGGENGADPRSIAPGMSYFGAVQGEARALIVRALKACLDGPRVLESDYECSSPSQVRVFRMRLIPVQNARVLVEHSLRIDLARVGPLVGADEQRYRGANGLLIMCSNCRRTLRRGKEAWDFVPKWTVDPPHGVSHGICPVCAGYFY